MAPGDLSTRGTRFSIFKQKLLFCGKRYAFCIQSEKNEENFFLLQLPSNVTLMNFYEIPFVQLYTAQTVLLVKW